MLNSKQRAKLRSLANSLDPVVYVGKEGTSENIIKEADVVLEKRELIKVSVQRGCDETPREVASEFCEKLKADPVLVVGKKFVIYRKAKENSANLI